jgi:hypothetical protein
MVQPTDGATLVVGPEHAFTEGSLVHAKSDDRGAVSTFCGKRRRIVELRSSWRAHLVVDRHNKRESLG